MKTIYSIYKDFLSNVDDKVYRIFDAQYEDGSDIFERFKVNIQSKSNILIIYGDNCSGKSLFANILETIAKNEKVIVRSASMKNRTKSGIEKALILGDESRQSTGETSVSFAEKSLINTLKENELALSVLDEPDLGLSDYYCAPFGEFIASYSNQFTEKQGLLLISHSKKLMKSFLKHNDQNISTLGINTTLSLDEWLENNDEGTVDELKNLRNMAKDKEIRISKTLER